MGTDWLVNTSWGLPLVLVVAVVVVSMTMAMAYLGGRTVGQARAHRRQGKAQRRMARSGRQQNPVRADEVKAAAETLKSDAKFAAEFADLYDDVHKG